MVAALDRRCAASCITKSQAVRESIAAYLVCASSQAASREANEPWLPSPAYQAFADAGLVGSVDLSLAMSSDKFVVRERVRRMTF